MNRVEIELLADQVRRLTLEIPIQDAEFQSVVNANLGKKNAFTKVEQAFLSTAASRDSLIGEMRRAIESGSKLNLRMVASRKLAESLRGGLDSPSPLMFIFDSIVELNELAERTKTGSRVQPDSEVTAWVRKYWHLHNYKRSVAIRAYMEKYEKADWQYDSLYAQVDNDHRKRPLKKPENLRKKS